MLDLQGFVDYFFDSLLGATVERRGWLGNDLVNFASTVFAAMLGCGCLSALRALNVGLAFEPTVQPADVEIEAEGGVADDLMGSSAW